MKLRSILNQLLSESSNLELDKIINKLEGYKVDYAQENNSKFVKIITSILDKLNNGKIQDAFDEFADSDLKYDIGQTYTDLKTYKDNQYLEKNYDMQWGLKAGTFIAWRAGTVTNSKNGIFFSIDERGAKQYSDGGSRKVQKYEVMIRKPLVAKNHIDAYSILTKTPSEKIIKTRDNSKNVGDWWVALDTKIVSAAKKQGYDSVTYTKPSPPALKELIVFNTSQVKLIE